MKIIKKYFHIFLLTIIFIFGFLLRFLPGQENLIWSYDQARDSVVIRSILGEKNIVIVGPQTEYVGLSHGPLYYYLMAPFYHLGQSNLSYPLIAMIVVNLSTIIPAYLLCKKMFANKKWVGILGAFLFVIAYQQIEYSRWLSNVSITIPFLAWFYYFLWEVINKQKIKLGNYSTTDLSLSILAGLSLGLAIQGELFLLYLIPISYLFYYFYKLRLKSWLGYHLGLLIGLATFILAEIKFKFTGSKTFINHFLFDNATNFVKPSQSFLGYLDHLGLTTYQNIFGLTAAMGLIFLIALIVTGFLLNKNIKNEKQLSKNHLPFILGLLFSHSILFSFHYVDSVFLDLSITLPIILLFITLIYLLWQNRQLLLLYGILAVGVATQLLHLYSNTKNESPMQTYRFHQGSILFSQKKEIVETIYQLVNDYHPDEEKKFTLGVLGTPYGVQTTWATLFENVLAEHPEYLKPDWFGFHALGYPYDQFFTKVDHPEAIHVVIIEDSAESLINEKIVKDYLDHADESTKVIWEEPMAGFMIQVREKINKDDRVIK